MMLCVGLESAAQAQARVQLVITVNLAGPVKPAGGAYFVAFTVDDSILLGPQSDSTYWTHYVLYREGRFFFGQIPTTQLRPFEFFTVRPPQPFLFGQVLPGGRAVRVRVALTDLTSSSGPPPTHVNVNFVTVDDYFRPLDALGQGVSDRFGFMTIDLRKDTYVRVTHVPRNCADPAFCIVGGEIQVGPP
jgi:hypothetical protein